MCSEKCWSKAVSLGGKSGCESAEERRWAVGFIWSGRRKAAEKLMGKAQIEGANGDSNHHFSTAWKAALRNAESEKLR